MLNGKKELENMQYLLDNLDLNQVMERSVTKLSGGELQRFAIALTAIQRADV